MIDEYVSFSPERYVIEVNGQTISDRAFLVVVCNASQYGNNAFIAPGSQRLWNGSRCAAASAISRKNSDTGVMTGRKLVCLASWRP